MRLLLPSSALLLLIAIRPALADTPANAESGVLELYQTGKLFDKSKYLAVRSAFARLFEEQHREQILRAYGGDADAFTSWLNARPAFKENFYTALDPRFDRIDKALALFHDLWKRFPEQVQSHPNLAIAVAVTWDDERRGVYDYRHHQVRTKSTLPGDMVDAIGNFQYVVDNEKVMEGRIQVLPWELLCFVVDHRTPIVERLWAQTYYKSSKGRIRSWHQDVPYDYSMLKAAQKNLTAHPRLEGQDYTLGNIKERGGVCAMQADFAARVAKSVGIPAVYCSGPSAIRGYHAWWMYVHTQKGPGTQVRYSLFSDGRFAGKDLFYTGTVTDPHTGQRLLDRDLERELRVASRDVTAKRQAELIMRGYPLISERLRLDTPAKVAYVDQCLKVSQHNESAWLEFARLVKSGELEADQKQVVTAHLSTLYRTLGDYPDFIRRLLDDLVAIQADPSDKIRVYEQAVSLFERARRPDLACDARLKITEEWCQENRWQIAAQGLMFSVRKFPTEGRYVPRMTEKLQEVSGNYTGGSAKLAQLYLEIVPAMFAYYQDDDSTYAKKMYDQAMAYFQDNQMTRQATALEFKARQFGVATSTRRGG
jgi:hypothetical protein